jgi:hypothetical protein
VRHCFFFFFFEKLCVVVSWPTEAATFMNGTELLRMTSCSKSQEDAMQSKIQLMSWGRERRFPNSVLLGVL